MDSMKNVICYTAEEKLLELLLWWIFSSKQQLLL